MSAIFKPQYTKTDPATGNCGSSPQRQPAVDGAFRRDNPAGSVEPSVTIAAATPVNRMAEVIVVVFQ